MYLSIVGSVGLALSVVAVFLLMGTTRAHTPFCPADWPDIDINAPVINELHHTDGNGDRWVVFGNPPLVRAYPADDRYKEGYAASASHETCNWHLTRGEQIYFADDDEDSTPSASGSAVPQVRIETFSSPVIEGQPATFTLRADPAPTSPLTVRLNVAQSGNYVESALLGAQTATIPSGGSASHYAMATIDDNLDERHGAVTVSVATSSDGSYTVAEPPGNAATVTIRDNDPGSFDNGNGNTNVNVNAGSNTCISGGSLNDVELEVGSSVRKRTVTVAEGRSTTYRVRLADNPRPDGDVAIRIEPSKPNKVSVSPARLVFEGTQLPNDPVWNEWQTVTVEALDDADSNDETVTITHTITLVNVTCGTWGLPAGTQVGSVTVTVNDDD